MHSSTKALLSWFSYDHLPEGLIRETSAAFQEVAKAVAQDFSGPELSACLRKLLEAKDCAVRCAVDKERTKKAAAHRAQEVVIQAENSAAAAFASLHKGKRFKQASPLGLIDGTVSDKTLGGLIVVNCVDGSQRYAIPRTNCLQGSIRKEPNPKCAHCENLIYGIPLVGSDGADYHHYCFVNKP